MYVADAICSLAAVAAQVIVCVDDKTSDSTFEVARQHSEEVYLYRFEHFGQMRDQAIKYARHKWIFMLDDDEVVDPCDAYKLKALCDSQLSIDGEIEAFMFPRNNWLDMKRETKSNAYPDYQTRLFLNNGLIKCGSQPVHASVLGFTRVASCDGIHIQHFRQAIHGADFEWIDARNILYDRLTRRYYGKPSLLVTGVPSNLPYDDVLDPYTGGIDPYEEFYQSEKISPPGVTDETLGERP